MQPSCSSNTTLYTDPDKTFSIRFPKEWIISEGVKDAIVLAEIPSAAVIPVIKENMNIIYDDKFSALPLSQYVQSQIDTLKKLKGITVDPSLTKSTISHTTALHFTYTYTVETFGFKAIVYTIDAKKGKYVITGICDSNNYQKYEKAFTETANSFELR